jgi:hypothetical protein
VILRSFDELVIVSHNVVSHILIMLVLLIVTESILDKAAVVDRPLRTIARLFEAQDGMSRLEACDDTLRHDCGEF